MSIYWIWHSHYLYGSWDLEKFRFLPLYIGLGTWKNSTPELSPRVWDLEKFGSSPSALGLGKIPRPSFFLGYGTWKNSKLRLYMGSEIKKECWVSRASMATCCEVSLLCFLHISPELSLQTCSSWPRRCECCDLPKHERKHSTRKLIVVDVFFLYISAWLAQEIESVNKSINQL